MCSSTSAWSVLSGYHYRQGPCQTVKVTASPQPAAGRPPAALAGCGGGHIPWAQLSPQKNGHTGEAGSTTHGQPIRQYQPAPRDATPQPPSQQPLPRRFKARTPPPAEKWKINVDDSVPRTSLCAAETTAGPQQRPQRQPTLLLTMLPHPRWTSFKSAPRACRSSSHRGCSLRPRRTEAVRRPWSKSGEFRLRLRGAVGARRGEIQESRCSAALDAGALPCGGPLVHL